MKLACLTSFQVGAWYVCFLACCIDCAMIWVCGLAAAFLLHRHLSLLVICVLFPFGSSLLLHRIGLTWHCFWGHHLLSCIIPLCLYCLLKRFWNEHPLQFLACSFLYLDGAHHEDLQNYFIAFLHILPLNCPPRWGVWKTDFACGCWADLHCSHFLFWWTSTSPNPSPLLPYG